MTPQSFSYPTVYKNKIYIPPYGLDSVVDYMLVFDTDTDSFEKIQLQVDDSFEKCEKSKRKYFECTALPFCSTWTPRISRKA